MLRTIHTKLSYANVVATIALFSALGGGAYAAVKLPANSVGARQIKKDAVRSSDVKNSSLLAADSGPASYPPDRAGRKAPRERRAQRATPERRARLGSAAMSVWSLLR